MRKTIISATVGLGLAFSTATQVNAATKELTPQPEQMAQPISAAANDSKQVVCHHLMHEGLLMRRPVCLTKRAWERVRIQTQMAVADMEIRSH